MNNNEPCVYPVAIYATEKDILWYIKMSAAISRRYNKYYFLEIIQKQALYLGWY